MKRLTDIYNYETTPGLDFKGEKSLTQQQFAGDVDVNNIVARFMKTGMLSDDDVSRRAAVYADVSNVGDYQTMLNTINKVKAEFDKMPADIKNEFDNDPALMLDFMSKPENLDDCIEMGLLPASLKNAGVKPATGADGIAPTKTDVPADPAAGPA